MDLAWEDRAANHAKVERMLDGADPSPGDLVVLPELFDTGFSINVSGTADNDGDTLRFLLRIAEDLGVTVQGSRTLVRCDCAKARNCATVCAPGKDGDAAPLCEYHKVHPIGFLRETEAFEGGREVMSYRWRSESEELRMCPLVCYDLRFPELFRAGVDRGAECFALGANWPDARAQHWRALLIARAIENQAYVLGVNRCGSDPHLSYAGGTIALDPMGEVLGELGADEGVLSVDVDAAALRSWREKFPALKDRVDWLKSSR